MGETAEIGEIPEGESETEVEILIFDDGTDFRWIAELECDLPQLIFHKCASFEELEGYLDQFDKGLVRAPDLLALDVHCGEFEDFSMFDVDIKVDEARCGFQLYEHVLRPISPEFARAPALFFTSFPEGVRSIETARLAKQFAGRFESCNRELFAELLLRICQDEGWISEEVIKRAAGPDQDDYIKTFQRVSEELQLDEDEQCVVLGIVSRNPADIPQLLRFTTVANDRIDKMVAISVLLDQFRKSETKRTYLLSNSVDDRRLSDLLTSGDYDELVKLGRLLESKLGGAIL